MPLESDGLRIKLYMIKLLEDLIRELSGGECDGRIADINFAYHNSWLINKLCKRGEHIKF